MAATNPTGPDPLNQVISVATTEVADATPGPDYVTTNVDQPGLPGTLPGNVGPDDDTAMGEPAHEDKETDVWTARYAFGNFASRFLWGFALIFASLFAVYEGYATGKGHWRILAILLGSASTLFWLWLSFRIFKARLSHHYHLTTKRLFVTSGIMRHTREMMELEHLKEVSIRQERMLDHLFKVGTVVVVSNVAGAPIMYLLGINHPQDVVDQIYHHARKG